MKNYIKQINALPKAVKYLLFTEILLCTGLGAWGLSFNYLLQYKGLAESSLGSVAAVSPLVTALLAVFFGPICDRLGYKTSLVLGCIIKALAIAATYFAPQGLLLYGARVLSGVGDCLVLVSEFPYITSLVQGEAKNLAYTLLFGTTAISVFLGNMLGGAILGRFDAGMAYIIVAAAGVVIVMAASIMRLRLPQKEVPKAQKFKIYLPERRSIGIYMIFELIGYLGYFIAYSMLNLILRDKMGFSMQAAGMVLGTLSVAAGLAIFMCQPLARKFGRSRSAMVVMLVLAALYVVMALCGGYAFAVLAVVTAMMQHMIAGLIDGPMLGLVGETRKSAFSGMRGMMNQIGISGGTYAAGALLALPDTGIIYIVVGASILVQAAMFLFGLKKDMERAGEE